MNRRHLRGLVVGLAVVGLLPRLHLVEQRQAELGDLDGWVDFAMNHFGVG